MARIPWDVAPAIGPPTTDHCDQEVHSEEAEEKKPSKCPSIITSDREELIQSIKRGENPVWVPKHLPAEVDGLPQETVDTLAEAVGDQRAHLVLQSTFDTSSGLNHIFTTRPDPINRPPSALHAGDFRQLSSPSIPHRTPTPEHQEASSISTSPTPWQLDTAPSLARCHNGFNSRSGPASCTARARAPSLGSSLSSSFVLRAPTSPLAHAASNTSLDLAPLFEPELNPGSNGRSNRRRTLPPGAFNSLHDSASETQCINFNQLLPTLRRDLSLSQQSHRPRRSLNSFTYQPLSNPHGPSLLRSRRTSFGSDAASRQHAAMVGSFEESILRGRMSTAPSKPLDFVAQIGVLGKGNCRPSLKCPAHVSVPFPAVFYNYPSTGVRRTLADDSPSPYVGNIDLQHNLPPPQPTAARRRSHKHLDAEGLMSELTSPENTPTGKAFAIENPTKKQSAATKPLGGCYRIPEQGQLQIIIKNPNKTAVKLFLVPYNLEGMESGTKTFVRQRSFSAGPVLEEALGVHQAAAPKVDSPTDKQVLRYLIHLKFCCPVKGRHYLYDNVRVVFANRVPDGNEKLRNEVQLPEPRYSPWKSVQELHSARAGSQAPQETCLHRHSSGIGLSAEIREALEGFSLSHAQTADAVPPLATNLEYRTCNGDQSGMHNRVESHAVDTLPEQASQTKHPDVQLHIPDSHQDYLTATDQQLLSKGALTHLYPRRSPLPWLRGTDELNERCYSPPPPTFGDGLLSRQLREYSGRVSPKTPGSADENS